MLRRLLKESLIFIGATLFFLALCATVGVSTSKPPTSPPAEAARSEECITEELVHDGSRTCPLQDQQNRSLGQEP